MVVSITFEPVSQSNIEILFHWRNSSQFLQYCTNRKALSNVIEFEEELKRDFSIDRHLQFLILYNNRLLGTIYSYSFNKFDKYCFVSVFTDINSIGNGFSALATIKFCSKLFDEYDLFKIYFDVYEYNSNVISLLQKREIQVEGIFKKQHIFLNNRYDVYRFALYPGDLSRIYNKLKV